MSYSIKIIDNANQYSTSYNQYFFKYEVFDLDSNTTSSNFIFDDENNTITFSLVINNNIPKDKPQPSTQKLFVNFSPSILFNEGKNLFQKILINFTLNGNSYSVSSDNIAASSDSVIGILFTDSTEVIQGFLNNKTVVDKFILVPDVIKNESFITLNFTIVLIEEFSTYLRRKYPKFYEILYDTSKIYINVIEQQKNVSLQNLYSVHSVNKTYLLLDADALSQVNTALNLDNFFIFYF